jgi:hypothetical protein
MSVIKTALLTVWRPIRLKRELFSSPHRLDSISNKNTLIHCLDSPIFLLSLSRSSILNLRCQCVLSLQKHRCQSKFGTHVSTAPEEYGDTQVLALGHTATTLQLINTERQN